MGTDALQPVMDYFKALSGNDPGALMAATAPERGRVIDQYDTARKAIAEFSPRGGGTTSTLAQSRINEAGQISDLTSNARREAAGTLGTLGTQLTGLGLSAEQLASSDLNTVINAVLAREGLNTQKRGQNMEALTGAGSAIGQLLGIYLTRGQGQGA